MTFLLHPNKRCMRGVGKLDHSAKVMTSSSLHCKDTFSLGNLCRDTLKKCRDTLKNVKILFPNNLLLKGFVPLDESLPESVTLGLHSTGFLVLSFLLLCIYYSNNDPSIPILSILSVCTLCLLFAAVSSPPPCWPHLTTLPSTGEPFASPFTCWSHHFTFSKLKTNTEHPQPVVVYQFIVIYKK